MSDDMRQTWGAVIWSTLIPAFRLKASAILRQ